MGMNFLYPQLRTGQLCGKYLHLDVLQALWPFRFAVLTRSQQRHAGHRGSVDKPQRFKYRKDKALGYLKPPILGHLDRSSRTSC